MEEDEKDLTEGGEALPDRSMSGFPVSIGTGLALETLFNPIMEVIDEDREVVKLEDLNRYNAYIFNVETLIRNILSSLDPELLLKLDKNEVYQCLVEEISFIRDFFSSNGLQTYFFYNTYHYYKEAYPDKIRVAKTERQLYSLELTKHCFKRLSRDDSSITKFTQLIHYDSTMRALLLTHIPVDLLSYTKFDILDLLESHTGVIKTRAEFNSKYYPIPREDMSFLPFFEYLLTVFGDKVTFKPEPIKRRKEVFGTLKKLDVHPMMTEFSLSMTFKG